MNFRTVKVVAIPKMRSYFNVATRNAERKGKEEEAVNREGYGKRRI
jgi:hypothetical protein